MLHLRVIATAEACHSVQQYLDDHPTIVHLVRHDDATRRPVGTLFEFDVPREAANLVVGDLRQLGVLGGGAISVLHGQFVFSSHASEAEVEAPGEPTEAVVWDEVKARVHDDSELTLSWVVMLTVAVLIAACGLLGDSAILIVGAMVVGPDYGPVAATAIGLHLNRWSWIRRGVATLSIGFAVAMPAAAALTWLVDQAGWTPDVFATGSLSQTAFIAKPDAFSVMVAVLAAVAGVLSLTQDKAGSLVGVLISVTTVPAAAGIGVFASHGRWRDAAGSFGLLLINLVLLAAVGGAVLRAQRALFRRRAARVPRQS